MSAITDSTPDTRLTDEQLEAVDSDAPALVVTSPAGTGKTEVLVRRAERYVSDPENGHRRVLVMTYTMRAAEEFTSRLRHRIGTSMHRLTAETIHSFCQTLLSVHGGHIGLPLDFQVIAKDEDRAELLARHDASWRFEDGPQLFRELDLARARGDEHPRLALWRSALSDAGAVDYADMMVEQETAELQTFYVAATRPSRVLLLTRARQRPTTYGNRPTDPSPFLQIVQRSMNEHGP
ncbi:MAG: UvrD-helicase domain-containing protein [Acidimicrobiaceae bacterium]|nr:UvrD-helicase domain-containing protein [Acidimicrobiaceae bacterium]